jgi:hypothetical protein
MACTGTYLSFILFYQDLAQNFLQHILFPNTCSSNLLYDLEQDIVFHAHTKQLAKLFSRLYAGMCSLYVYNFMYVYMLSHFDTRYTQIAPEPSCHKHNLDLLFS